MKFVATSGGKLTLSIEARFVNNELKYNLSSKALFISNAAIFITASFTVRNRAFILGICSVVYGLSKIDLATPERNSIGYF